MKSINPEYLFKTFCIEHTVTSYLDLISGSDTDHRNKITWQRPKTPTLSVIPAWGKPVSSSQHLTGFFHHQTPDMPGYRLPPRRYDGVFGC